jgi:hypothetical protein
VWFKGVCDMDVRIEKKKSRTIQYLSTNITPFATLVEGIERQRDKLMVGGQEDKWKKTVGVRVE